MKISIEGQRSCSNHYPNCPNVQLSPQHILSCPEFTQAQLFKISQNDLEDLIFSDKAVEAAEVVFDNFGTI
ncbi:hypothetical protein TNCV_2216951 [Trichonephila clavipes]|nr:hypothetical protein TNCV_2216951 [Trichonephila clavipes]